MINYWKLKELKMVRTIPENESQDINYPTNFEIIKSSKKRLSSL